MLRLVLLLCLLSRPGWAEVQTFQGGTGNTVESFSVEGPWRLRWDLQGTALKVFIHHDRDGAVGKPIKQAGSGQGHMDFDKPGSYRLEIKCVGSYKLTVEPMATAGTLPSFRGGVERKGTAVFTAPEGWGFRWKFSGAALKVTLYDANRRQVGEPVKVVGGGSGERIVGPAGKYFFMIQSSGDYEIEIFKP